MNERTNESVVCQRPSRDNIGYLDFTGSKTDVSQIPLAATQIPSVETIHSASARHAMKTPAQTLQNAMAGVGIGLMTS